MLGTQGVPAHPQIGLSVTTRGRTVQIVMKIYSFCLFQIYGSQDGCTLDVKDAIP
jgi:hypothetical protein